MSDDVLVSNTPTSSNPDIPVRTVEKGAKQIQVVVVDYGGAGSENLNSPDFATQTTLAALNTKVTACNTGAVTVSSALPAGNNNIGDVDVATLPNVTLASQANPFTSAIPVSGSFSVSTTGLATDTNQLTEISYLTSIDGNIIKADTDNVTLKAQTNPFTSAIPVADNGGSLTVDGTVAATQSGTWNITNVSGTVSLPTGAATETTLSALNTKVTACNTGAVTISAALPAGTNNIGDVGVVTLPNVTLASQGNPFTAAIPVSDNGGSITIDGTVAATQSGTWNVTNVSGTISLPTGAATESTLASLNGKVTACDTGAVTISAALPAGNNNIGDVDVATLPNVTLASQANPFTSALPISDNGGSVTVDGTVAATQSGTWNITNVSGTVSLPTGAATETTLAALNTKVTACNTGAVTISAALPAGTNNIGDVDILTLPSVTLASQANPFSSAIPISDNGGSVTVDGTIAATQSGTWSVADATYSTSAVTSVTSAATNTNLLAANASRRQAVFYNDCDKSVNVKLGSTASSSSFSYRLLPGQTLELPNPVYTGAVEAIWDASPTGSMRVTEIT